MAKPNEDFEFVWELRVVDGKLTGTQKSPMGDAPIVDGRVDGTKLEFTIEQEFFGDIQRQTVTGEIVGDELRIKLPPPRRRAGAGPGPGGPGGAGGPGGPLRWDRPPAVLEVPVGLAALAVLPPGWGPCSRLR